MKKLKQAILWGVVGMWLLLAACATPPEPFQYKQSNDLKPGPGLFTGEEGVFTITSRPRPAEKAAVDSEKAIPEDPALQ